MAEICTSGQDLRNIKNRAYAKYETDKSEKIVTALDKSGIPYYAKFSSDSINITYDSDYKAAVEEIAARALSGDFEILLSELNKNPEIIISETADMLKVSVGFIDSRPEEIKDMLCKTFIDFWYCDSVTIKRKLWEVLKLSVNERSM